MLEIQAKSVYAPLKVKIHGKVYEAKSMTRPLWRQISVLEKRIKRGELECTYDQIELIFGKQAVWDKLEMREVNEIINYIAVQSFKAEKALKEEPGDKTEKKENGPGDKNSQK